MQRTIIVYLLIELAFIASCDFGKEDCGVLSDSSPRVGDMSARMVKYYSYNNVKTVNADDTVSISEFALWLDAEPFYLSKQRTGGAGRLYACSPQNPILANEIKNISISNTSDLNDSLQVGTDLTDFFAFKTLQSDEGISNLPLLNSYFQSDYYLFLVPTFEIDHGQYVQFDLRIVLDDDQHFDITSNKVFVQ